MTRNRKLRLEKPRPISDKAMPRKRPRVLQFPGKKKIAVEPKGRVNFAEFSNDVREWLEEQDYSE